MNDDRVEILRVLRGQERPPVAESPSAADGLPDDSTMGDVVAAFIAAAARNSAETRMIDGEDAAPAAVSEFLRGRESPPAVVCDEELSTLPWDAAGVSVVVRPPVADDNCGVTRIVAAAADTGAMLMTDARKHALTHSLLPPCHVALLCAADIVPSMAALWRRLPSPLPRCCSLTCGPSRTGDIEQTLVLGVHGPVAVLVLIVR